MVGGVWVSGESLIYWKVFRNCRRVPYSALTFARPWLYIADMAKNYKTTTAGKDDGKSKEYENHVCGECKRCTPVTKFHTLTVKDRKPTLGRCPEHTYCVLLSQRACPKIEL